jgi:hypothetical protein
MRLPSRGLAGRAKRQDDRNQLEPENRSVAHPAGAWDYFFGPVKKYGKETALARRTGRTAMLHHVICPPRGASGTRLTRVHA